MREQCNFFFSNSHAMGSCKTNRRTSAVGPPSELIGGWCPGHISHGHRSSTIYNGFPRTTRWTTTARFGAEQAHTILKSFRSLLTFCKQPPVYLSRRELAPSMSTPLSSSALLMHGLAKPCTLSHRQVQSTMVFTTSATSPTSLK